MWVMGFRGHGHVCWVRPLRGAERVWAAVHKRKGSAGLGGWCAMRAVAGVMRHVAMGGVTAQRRVPTATRVQ